MDYNITYRQKDKGIQVIISYKDDLGKWKQKSKQGFTNTREGKKKAKYWADETIQELKSTISLDSTLKDITFKEFTDIYLDYLRLRREPKTVNAYKIAINKFEKLNNIPVNKISKLNIQTCVDDMLSHSLMKSTIKIYINKLKTIFNACTTNYNIIKTNPVSDIDIGIDKIKKEKTALTKSQLDDLLNKLSKLSSSKQIYFIAALLASKCGLRVGEICGLKWSDIDFKNNTIKIDRQLKKNEDKKWYLGTLKSKNSYRNIPMPSIVKKELLEYKANNPINFDGLILNRNVDSIANNISKLFTTLGYDISIHELRHTYATLLIANGVDFKTAAKLLGHDVKETLKTYSHVNDDMMERASQLIENIF